MKTIQEVFKDCENISSILNCEIENMNLYKKSNKLELKLISRQKINIKDYIEVNSAIAMALQGLGYGVKDMNFKKHSLTDNLPEWMTVDIGSPNANSKIGNGLKEFFATDWKAKLDTTERWLLRVAAGFLILILLSLYVAYNDVLRIF